MPRQPKAEEAEEAEEAERFTLLAPKLPGKSPRFFYFVEIHPDDVSMNRGLAELQGRSPKAVAKEKIVAACLRYEFVPQKSEEEAFKHIAPIGTLFFSQPTVSPSVVAHELAHAAIGWCRRVKLDPTKNTPSARHAFDQEEMFASCLQTFTKQFWDARP